MLSVKYMQKAIRATLPKAPAPEEGEEEEIVEIKTGVENSKIFKIK